MAEKRLVDLIFQNIDLLKETLLYTWNEDLIVKIKSDIKGWEEELEKISIN